MEENHTQLHSSVSHRKMTDDEVDKLNEKIREQNNEKDDEGSEDEGDKE